MANQDNKVSSSRNSKVRVGTSAQAIADLPTAALATGEIISWDYTETYGLQDMRTTEDFYDNDQIFSGSISGNLVLYARPEVKRKWTAMVRDIADVAGTGGHDYPIRLSEDGEGAGNTYVDAYLVPQGLPRSVGSGAAQTLNLSFKLKQPVFGSW